jgi:virginiamycin B lyase
MVVMLFSICLITILFLLFLLVLSTVITTNFIQDKQQQYRLSLYYQNAMALSEDKNINDDATLKTFKKEFCGLGGQRPHSNEYITEYILPQSCEMPLGIAVDNNANKVWYVSTKKGVLGSYDLKRAKFDEEHQIPEWKSRQNPRGFSQVWDIKIDRKEGDIWFTDQIQNIVWRYIKSSNVFEKYNIPGKSNYFGTIYPMSIEFDRHDDNIMYFVGTFLPSLWIADITKLKNSTSNGISEIPIPINGFKGIHQVYVVTGLIAFDDKRDAVWISMLAYGKKGQIFRYDLDSKSFEIFDLPKELNSPWGLTVDNDGNLWVTNVGTSLFYKLNPDKDNNIITKFVTSKTSPRIFGDTKTINKYKEIYKNSYTIPSMIKKSNDGDEIWFNQQYGNKIAKFSPSDRKLIEYWIPTQNRLWGICSNDNDITNSNTNGIRISDTSSYNRNRCGIANVLQFSIGHTNDNNNKQRQIWFTEWSENKIGKLDIDKKLPFSVSVFKSDKELSMHRGQNEKIKIRIKAAESPSYRMYDIRMIAAGTFTSTGDLGNSKGHFNKQSISLDREGEEKLVSFVFRPSRDLKPGDYTLMIGAENDSISYLRAIKITISL